MERPSKPKYYLGIAQAVSERSTCLNKHYGAVIVKDDQIVSTGYNGSPRGHRNCVNYGKCLRVEKKVPRGTRYDICASVHGEANAIIQASPEEMKNATLYLYGYDATEGEDVKSANCCPMCKRMIINAGIKDIIIADPENILGWRCVQVASWTDQDINPDSGY